MRAKIIIFIVLASAHLICMRFTYAGEMAYMAEFEGSLNRRTSSENKFNDFEYRDAVDRAIFISIIPGASELVLILNRAGGQKSFAFTIEDYKRIQTEEYNKKEEILE